MRRKLLALGVVGASLGASTGVAQAAPFTNGSFEQPAVGNTFNVTGTTITGWTITAGNVDILGPAGTFAPQNGNQAIDLNGSVGGTICQTLDTTIGSSYTVAYGLYVSGSPRSLTASITGGPSSAETHDSVGGASFSPRFLNFTATASSSQLCFASAHPGGAYGPVIDDVTVSEVLPVPVADGEVLAIAGGGAAALALSGFAFVAMRRRRRDAGLA